MTNPSPMPPRPGQFYTVASGDTLAQIAAVAYGQEDKWNDIYQVNQNKIGDDPNHLEVGMIIAIPE